MKYKILLWLMVGGVCLNGVIVANPEEAQLITADEIQVDGDMVQQERDNSQKKTVIQALKKKIDLYKGLADSQDPQVSVQAMTRLAVIYHDGLYGLKPSKNRAFPYWLALTNQVTDRSMRAQACEILGMYYREGWVNEQLQEIKPDLIKAKAYFTLAKDLCPEQDSDIRDRAAAALLAVI